MALFYAHSGQEVTAPPFTLWANPAKRVMRAPLTLSIAAALLFAMSCDGTTGPQPHGQPIHLFRADALTIHDSLQSFCGIEGELPVQRGSLPPWSGQASVTLYRWVATTHGVVARPQTPLTIPFSVPDDSPPLIVTLAPPDDPTHPGSARHAGPHPTHPT